MYRQPSPLQKKKHQTRPPKLSLKFSRWKIIPLGLCRLCLLSRRSRYPREPAPKSNIAGWSGCKFQTFLIECIKILYTYLAKMCIKYISIISVCVLHIYIYIYQFHGGFSPAHILDWQIWGTGGWWVPEACEVVVVRRFFGTCFLPWVCVDKISNLIQKPFSPANAAKQIIGKRYPWHIHCPWST